MLISFKGDKTTLMYNACDSVTLPTHQYKRQPRDSRDHR